MRFCFVDEPNKEFDREIGPRVAAMLATTLCDGFGFDQAAVVSHDPALVSKMPHVLRVERGDDGASVTEWVR